MVVSEDKRRLRIHVLLLHPTTPSGVLLCAVFSNPYFQPIGHHIYSVFPTESFLRPGMHVRRFGHKLNALDNIFMYNFDSNLLKKGLSALKFKNFQGQVPQTHQVSYWMQAKTALKSL